MQVPPFSRGDHSHHPGTTSTPPPPPAPYPAYSQVSPSVPQADLKCTMCPFETGNREVYENHMSLHSKDSQEQQHQQQQQTGDKRQDYLEYIRKIHEAAEAANGGRQTSPGQISSSTASGLHLGRGRTPPPPQTAQQTAPSAGSQPAATAGFNTESHLFTRLYLENMAKTAAAAASGKHIILIMIFVKKIHKMQ